jgi:hypothetical protein
MSEVPFGASRFPVRSLAPFAASSMLLSQATPAAPQSNPPDVFSTDPMGGRSYVIGRSAPGRNGYTQLQVMNGCDPARFVAHTGPNVYCERRDLRIPVVRDGKPVQGAYTTLNSQTPGSDTYDVRFNGSRNAQGQCTLSRLVSRLSVQDLWHRLLDNTIECKLQSPNGATSPRAVRR